MVILEPRAPNHEVVKLLKKKKAKNSIIHFSIQDFFSALLYDSRIILGAKNFACIKPPVKIDH